MVEPTIFGRDAELEIFGEPSAQLASAAAAMHPRLHSTIASR